MSDLEGLDVSSPARPDLMPETLLESLPLPYRVAHIERVLRQRETTLRRLQEKADTLQEQLDHVSDRVMWTVEPDLGKLWNSVLAYSQELRELKQELRQEKARRQTDLASLTEQLRAVQRDVEFLMETRWPKTPPTADRDRARSRSR